MLNPKKISRIWVFTQKSAFMQRVADYVRNGHRYYIQGKTDTEKIFVTWEKLVTHNPVFNDSLKAFRAREKGEPTGRLLLYQNRKSPEKIHWILMMHSRKDQLPSGEKWLHAEDQGDRIFFTGYELVRVTKEGTKKPTWTWRYTKETYESLRNEVIYSIRSNNDKRLADLIDKIFSTMGFSGSRAQAKMIVELIKEEWKRRRPHDQMPELPGGIGWVRRKSDKGVFLHRKDVVVKEKTSPEVVEAEEVVAEFEDDEQSKVNKNFENPNFKFSDGSDPMDPIAYTENLIRQIEKQKGVKK